MKSFIQTSIFVSLGAVGLYLGTVVNDKLVAFLNETPTSVESKVVELHITLASDGEETRKTTKRIYPVNAKAICSGAFVDADGLILTARHCTEGVTSMEVLTSDHSVYQASFVAKSSSQDLALVRIDRHNTPFFTVADTLKRGQHIFILGSPMGETDVLSQGYIARLGGDRFIVDASVAPGNSGGPVFDEAGRLAGVAVAVYVSNYGMTHLGVVESNDAVRAFLKLVLKR